LASKHLEVIGKHKKSNWSKRTDLIINLSIVDLDKSILATGKVIFTDLAPNTILNAAALAGHGSDWFPNPEFSTESEQVLADVKKLQGQLAGLKQLKKKLNGFQKNGSEGEKSYNAMLAHQELIRKNTMLLDAPLKGVRNKMAAAADGKKPKTSKVEKDSADLMAAIVGAKIALSTSPKVSLSDAVNTVEGSIAKVEGNLKRKRDYRKSFKPVMIKANLIQTKKASAFMKKVGEIAAASREDLSNVARTYWDPVYRRNQAEAKAKEDKTESDTKAEEEYQDKKKVLTADNGVLAAEAELAKIDPTTDLTTYQSKKYALSLKKLDANEVRRKAGYPQIYEVTVQ